MSVRDSTILELWADIRQTSEQADVEQASYIGVLEDIESVEAWLGKLQQRNEDVDRVLANELQIKSRIEAEVGKLQQSQDSLKWAGEAHTTLLQNLQDTRTIAVSLKEKIITLQETNGRVRETMKFVEDIQELKSYITEIYEAMEAQNWELAAEVINEANHIPSAILSSEFAAAIVPSTHVPDSPQEYMATSSKLLFALFSREFDLAANARDEKLITQYFKLFPLIGYGKEGLELYARFVCAIVSGRAHAAMTRKDEKENHVLQFIGLVEHVAHIIDSHKAVVERYYGKGSMLPVVTKLHTECVRQAGVIVDTLWSNRNFARKMVNSRSYSFNYLVHAMQATSSYDRAQQSLTHPQRVASPDLGAAIEVDKSAKEIDSDMNEIALIFGRWKLYIAFMARTASQSEDDLGRLPDFLASSAFDTKLAKSLKPAYSHFETYLLRRSVELAFKLDEIDSDSETPSSSVVDDVMFILKKIVERALSTGDVEIVRSVVGGCRRILESDYAGLFQRRLQRGFSLPSMATMASKSVVSRFAQTQEDSVQRERLDFVVTLNNLNLSSQFSKKIVENLVSSELLSSQYSLEGELKSVMSIIKGLAGLQERCLHILEDGISAIYNQLIKPNINILLQESFKDNEYVVDNMDVVNKDDTTMRRFATGWDNLFLKFKVSIFLPPLC